MDVENQENAAAKGAYGEALEQIKVLEQSLASGAHAPTAGLSGEARSACKILDGLLDDDPTALLTAMEDHVPLEGEPLTDGMMTAIASSRITEALGAGKITLSNLKYLFSRPAAIRRLVNVQAQGAQQGAGAGAGLPAAFRTVLGALDEPSVSWLLDLIAGPRRRWSRALVPLLIVLTTLAMGALAIDEVWIVPRLREEIERSGVGNAIRIGEPAINVSGRDSLRVTGTVDLRYINRVTWDTGRERLILVNQAAPAGEEKLQEFSRLAEVPLDGKAFTSWIEFEPFPEVKENLPSFFPKEVTFRQRTFLPTLYGVVADPKPEDIKRVATLDTITHRPNAENPNLYVVSGRIYRTPGNRYGWLIINPVLSGNMFVSSALSIDEGVAPLFRTWCFLGNERIDQEEYELFVVLADRPDALVAGQQIPNNYDWTGEGFLRSEAALKINDGTDGFAESRETETGTPESQEQ